MRRIGFVLAAALALALAAGPASASGPPVIIPIDDSLEDVNPCSGQVVTVLVTGTLQLHEFYNEGGDVHHTNILGQVTLVTSDGFTGSDVFVSVHNAEGPFGPREDEDRGMEVSIENIIARNPTTGQVARIHASFLLVYVSEDENVVESSTLTFECVTPSG